MLHTLGTVKFYMRSYIITSLKSYRNWMLFYKDHFFPFILEPMNELFASHLPKSCTFLGLNFFFFQFQLFCCEPYRREATKAF